MQVCQVTGTGENEISGGDLPAYSARYKKIVYARREGGAPSEIFLANPDGSAAEPLAGGFTPAVSPDGGRVYYIGRNGASDGGVDLYVADLETRHATRITHTDAQSIFSWSPPATTPKGDLLVYAAGAAAHTVYADGSGDTPLELSDPDTELKLRRVRVSPTHANLILYNREPDKSRRHPLWVFDAQARRTYALTNNASQMFWAPDGIHIAYSGGKDMRFHLARYDGKQDRVLDRGVREATGYCSFTPEGDALACANVDRTGRLPFPGSIFLLSADGSGRVAYLCLHRAQHLSPRGWPTLRFAQDRYHLLFRSDGSGTPQVFLATLPTDIYERLTKPPRPITVPRRRRSRPEFPPPGSLR